MQPPNSGVLEKLPNSNLFSSGLHNGLFLPSIKSQAFSTNLIFEKKLRPILADSD